MYNTTTTQQRAAFNDGDVSTASPRGILVKCFDRLDSDLAQALDAIDRHDPETANSTLSHAQDLLGEVAGMVDTDAWRPAAGLLSIYDYVLRLLALANMRKAPGPVVEARTLLTEIGDAFREASATVDRDAVTAAVAARPPAPAPTTSSPFDSPRTGGFSISA